MARLGLIDFDRVAVRPAPSWLVRAWRGDIAAMTTPWAIYVRRQALSGDAIRLAALLLHELVHVRQWQELGTVRFLRRYLADYWRGRRAGLGHDAAYRDIPFEREARQVVTEYLTKPRTQGSNQRDH
ncbi:MAG: hypothetical protein ACT4OP_12810 [Actinomycetota bacterium]